MTRKGIIFAVVLSILIPVSMAVRTCVSAPKTINLKFSNYLPPTAPYSTICEEFINDLEKLSGGRIKVQYFSGGSLLKAQAMYKGITSGITDIGLSHIEYTPGRFPVTEACDIPLGFSSGWVASQVVNDFYNEFRPKEWDKVKILWMHASNPNVIISKKPVRRIEDLKGLSIRAPGRVGDTIKALGGNPAPTPLMEAYDAISKGVIDGINTPFETLKSFRFAEVAGYVTSNWQVGNIYTFFVAMNKNSYKKLPPDLKEVFDRLCGEYKERMALIWNMIDIDGFREGKGKGLEIIELNSEEADKFIKATAPVIEDYIDKMIKSGHSESEVRGWINFLRERIDYWTEKQISIGLKSPTGPEEMRISD